MNKQERNRIADAIADQLGERTSRARKQMRLMVKVCGVEFMQDVLQQTLKLEAEGGMLTQDQSRRRTPGGVFFQLAKQQMPEDIRQKYFLPVWQDKSKRRAWRQQKKRRKQQAQQQPEKIEASPHKEQSTEAGQSPPMAIVVERLRERIAEMEASGAEPGELEINRELLTKMEKKLERATQ